MADDVPFRLVVLFACWSYDSWLDLRAAQRKMVLRSTAPAGKADPSDWELILAARFDVPPSKEKLAAALDATSAKMLDCDGHAVLHSSKVVGEAEWRQLAGGHGDEVDAVSNAHPHRLVASYDSLEAASSVLSAASPPRVQHRSGTCQRR